MDAARGLSRRSLLEGIGAATAIAGLAPALASGAEQGPSPQLIPRSPGFSGGPGVCGRMTGAAAVARALQLERAPCVFGVPGAQNNEFWDSMKTLGMPYFLVTHESSASVMADASARVTGEVGCFSVVPGPGLTNALTGVGEALLDTVPIVGLITDVDRSPTAPAFQVHSLAGAAIARPVSKLVIEVRHVAQLPGAIHQAFAAARCGPPGPVSVVIPYNLLTEVWSYQEAIPAAQGVPFDEDAYRRAVATLSDRRRRVGIYAGQGTFAASGALAAVSEMLQAPVATSVSGKGAIPDSHPLAVGWGYGPQGSRLAENAFNDVDLVLAVGVRYSEVSTANYSIPPKEPLVHVDVDPQALGKNVPVTVPVHADAGVFLTRLLADAQAVARPADPELHRRVALWRQEDQRTYGSPQIRDAVDPMYLMYQLRCALPPEALLFVDVTASTHWAAECLSVPGPRHYFAPTNNQSMGWSIPAAIAGAAVGGGRPVAAIVGDGCFLMSAVEMSSAARMGLPVKFFVLEDGAYHYMQMLQLPQYRRTTATELAKIDYAAFARAMGLGYVRIDGNGAVPSGISMAMGRPEPTLVHVRIGYEGREIRWLSAAKRHYLQGLERDEKIRMASKVARRSVTPHRLND